MKSAGERNGYFSLYPLAGVLGGVIENNFGGFGSMRKCF